MKAEKINRIKLTKRHFRVFVTMDQLAAKMKTCRSAIDSAVDRFLSTNAFGIETKLIRTGKRGPATKAYRISDR